jgi:hypothetical protein
MDDSSPVAAIEACWQKVGRALTEMLEKEELGASQDIDIDQRLERTETLQTSSEWS